MPYVVSEEFCCVGCKIEGIASQERGGAIQAESSSNFIKFKLLKCHFLDCSSADYGGSIFGIGLDGFVKFTKFEFCHSGNCGTAYGGNAFLIENSKLDIECNQAYQCWNSSKSGDSCFQVIGDDYVLNHINVSNCIDNGSGAMIGNYDGVNTVRASFLQHYGCTCNHAFVTGYTPNTGGLLCSKVNLISNKYGLYLLWQNAISLRVEYACIFKNTGGTDLKNSPVIVNSIGDVTLDGVTKKSFSSHDLRDDLYCVYKTVTHVDKAINSLESTFFHFILCR